MYRTDLVYTSPELKTAQPTNGGVLVERNHRHRPQWLSDISASNQRRREVLLLKQRKERMRRKRMVRRLEYQRLRNMVPSIRAKPLVSKVTVIEEAIRYIDYLHSALLTRLRTRGLPSCLRGVDVDVNQLNLDGIKNLVFQLFEKKKLKTQQSAASIRPETTTTQRPFDVNSPVSVFERSRFLPSYLTAKRPLPKRT